MVKSSLGFYVQGDYSTDCLTAGNPIWHTQRNEFLSCIKGVYIQYQDQAIVVTMTRSDDTSGNSDYMVSSQKGDSSTAPKMTLNAQSNV